MQVTIIHIVLITVFTIIEFLNDNFYNSLTEVQYRRVGCAFYISSGVLDLFVSMIMWFVIDEKSSPMFFKDERVDMVYPILNILKEETSEGEKTY